jgi:hypothetical protein
MNNTANFFGGKTVEGNFFISSNFLKTANIIILMRKKNHNLQNFISVMVGEGEGERSGQSFAILNRMFNFN